MLISMHKSFHGATVANRDRVVNGKLKWKLIPEDFQFPIVDTYRVIFLENTCKRFLELKYMGSILLRESILEVKQNISGVIYKCNTWLDGWTNQILNPRHHYIIAAVPKISEKVCRSNEVWDVTGDETQLIFGM